MPAGKGVVKGLGGKGMWPGGAMGLGAIRPWGKKEVDRVL
jgi:hypothetical protein